MKILITGYGSIGKKHAQNLKSLGANVSVWRKRSSTKGEVEADGFQYFHDLDEAIENCDGVVIATSSSEHLEPALKAAQKKKPIYLEKPVSNTLDGLDDLVKACQGLVVEVGCQLRHHPALIALKEALEQGICGKPLAFQGWVGQRLDQWRPDTDYRQSYSADASKGGGALFDLVHEIDLMTWLVGPVETVQATLSQNSDLEMKAEDLANLILSCKNKATGTVQLDMLSPAYRRGLQIITDKIVYRWDMKTGKTWQDNGGGETVLCTAPDDYQPSQMLFDSMAYFLKRIENSSLKPHCSLEEGVHDLHILLAAKKADTTGMKQHINDITL